MFCADCGSKLGEKARFCAGCGNPTPRNESSEEFGITSPISSGHLREEEKNPRADEKSLVDSLGDTSPSFGGHSTPKSLDSDPFAGINHPLEEDEEDPGVSWLTAMRSITEHLAEAWFDLPDRVPTEPWVREQLGDDEFESIDSLYRAVPSFSDSTVSPSTIASRETLGETVSLNDSSLWKKISEYFEQRGIQGIENPGFAANGMVVDTGVPMMWVGSWGTEFGTRTLIRIEIRQSPDGNENAYFHTNMAVATRRPSPPLLQYPRLGPLAQFTLPMLFVAESPLPSSVFALPRQFAYEDVPEHLWPRPMVCVDEYVVASFVLPGGTETSVVEVQNQVFPVVASAGFVLTEDHVGSHLATVVNTVLASLTNLATIVEDGFRNHRNQDSPIPFDAVFGSEYWIAGDEEGGQVPGVKAGGMSRWIAETHLGALAGATYDRLHLLTNNLVSGEEFDRVANWIIEEGAGAGVSGAINLLVSDYVIPDEDWVGVERLSSIVLELDTAFEVPRALSNMGYAYSKAGLLDEAKTCLLEAIHRPDCSIEAEVCFRLGEVATEAGSSQEAQQWFERGSTAGSDGQEDFARLCAQRLSSGP